MDRNVSTYPVHTNQVAPRNKWALHRKAWSMGALGASVVALSFLVLNLLMGRPALETPASLGTLMLYGADAFDIGVQYSVATILSYTAVHLAAFVGLGYGMSFAGSRMKKYPAWSAFFLLLSAVVVGPMIGATTAAGEIMGVEIRASQIALAHFLAILSMSLWMWRNSPALRRHFARGGWDHADGVRQSS